MRYETAIDLLTGLRSGRYSSVGLVDAGIEAITRTDDQLNAVVVRDFDNARKTAKAADAERLTSKNRPLLGLRRAKQSSPVKNGERHRNPFKDETKRHGRWRDATSIHCYAALSNCHDEVANPTAIRRPPLCVAADRVECAAHGRHKYGVPL
jgi:hypothetical protein